MFLLSIMQDWTNKMKFFQEKKNIYQGLQVYLMSKRHNATKTRDKVFRYSTILKIM